jgi:ribosomal protein L11 methylase PrmA
MDVGCGNGDMLSAVKRLGWQAIGLYIDTVAVRAPRTRGLYVLEGSHARSAKFK